MDLPIFANGQFIDAPLVQSTAQTLLNDIESIGSSLHTPGLISPSVISHTTTNLVSVWSFPPPFAVLFASGAVVGAHGTVNGSDTSSYSIDFTSLIPGSGSVTAYVIASYSTVGEDLTTVIGPPPGHPDYNPNFNPFEMYALQRDTLAISGSLVPPNNTTSFEIARVTLSAGQTRITDASFTTNKQIYASAVLNPTGVSPGTYTPATITVDAFGRLSSASQWTIPNSGVAAGTYPVLHATVGSDGRVTSASDASVQNNTWTGSNTFTKAITATDSSIGGVIVAGGANSNGANLKLQANSGNKWIRALNNLFQVVNSAYTAALLTVDDNGNVTAAGNFAANGATIGAGGINSAGSIIAGSGGVQSNGPVSSFGNVVANSGRVRAAFGSVGSGDPNAATILNDFQASLNPDGWAVFPCAAAAGGLIVQWGFVNVPPTNTPTLFNLPRAFPNAALAVVCSYGAHFTPTGGSVGADFANNSQIFIMNTFTQGTGNGVYFIAIGF